MSTASKRIISVLLVLFVIAASFVFMPPASASALSQINYSVSYSGKYVYLKLTPRKSTDKIYYTTDGSAATRKSTRYTKSLAASSMTFIRAVEYNKNNKKVAVINVVIKPRAGKPQASVTLSGGQLYVKLTSSTSDAKIYYTTDGSKPSKSSKLYTGEIKCKEGTVIRARAYKNKMNASKIMKLVVKSPTVSKPSNVTQTTDDSDDDGYITITTRPDTGSDNTVATTNTEPEESVIEGVFRIINEERSAAGLSKLTLDSSLCTVADVRAKELETSYSHYRPDGTACFTVLDDYGITYMAVGENIAYGMNKLFTAKEVMTEWMNSPGHRANILSSSFGKVGVGCYRTGSFVYWVQMFTD